MAEYVDRFLRFPSRAVAVAFAASPPFGVALAPNQTAAGGEGWALMEAGAAGVMRTPGAQIGEEPGEGGEPVPIWETEPAPIPGYHVVFTIRADLPRASEILAAIDASGFAVADAEPRVRWARD